ncbi:MAG: glutamate--tRNA ligase family protein [Acidobacteriota bacterium]
MWAHGIARDDMPIPLAPLAARLPSSPLTRFAPAPTGFLHVGHVVNAIYVWGIARALGGRVGLRVEDHDRQRCRPEYEAALLDDLDWLGLQPDVYPTSAFRAGICEGRQSDRQPHYQRAAQTLIAHGLVFGCDCTRREIDAANALAAHADPGELRYPGTCRARGLSLGGLVGWRLVVEPGAVSFDDVVHGVSRQEPWAQCGDLLLRDRLGNWTYQFAVAVDDMTQGVDLVVRGDDIFASTGRQMLLARHLGRSRPPVFFHHPLVMKSATQKLSKSDGDSGVRDLRAAGWSAGRVLGHAAHLAGLIERERDVSVDELPPLVGV